MWAKAQIAKLDKQFPPRGPCLMCGHKDARHRLWDAIMHDIDRGEIIEEVSANYDVSFEGIDLVMGIRPYRLDRRKNNPT